MQLMNAIQHEYRGSIPTIEAEIVLQYLHD